MDQSFTLHFNNGRFGPNISYAVHLLNSNLVKIKLLDDYNAVFSLVRLLCLKIEIDY